MSEASGAPRIHPGSPKDPPEKITCGRTLRARARGRSLAFSALRLLAALALVVPGLLAGCEGGTTFVGGSFTVGCGAVEEGECPPRWALSVRVRAAEDGQPIPGAQIAIARYSYLDTLSTGFTGQAYLPETGPFSPCSVMCGGLWLGTTDCIDAGLTDESTSVTVSAAGFASRSGTVILTRASREVDLTLDLPAAP